MQKIIKSLVTALLIVIPLYPKFPAIRIMGTYVSVRIEDFLIAGTLLLFLPLILKNTKIFLKEKVSRSILLFLGIGFVSLISAIFVTQTVSTNIATLHLFRRIEYFSLFVIGFLYIRSEKGNDFFPYLLKILLLVNLFVFLYGFGQKYFNLPIIITQNEEYSKGIALRYTVGSHINSSFAGHYDLASYLVLVMPFFISSFFVLKGKWTKIILFISVGLGFWLLSSAVSRISIVAFVLAVSVSLLLLKKYKEVLMMFIITVLMFGFSVDLRARYKQIIDVTLDKITELQSVVMAAEDEIPVFEDRSTSIRLAVEWPRAIRAITKNPILGTGYSSISLATDNDYLRALGEVGILGFLAFLLIILNIFKYFREYKFSNEFETVFFASIIGSTIGILLTAVFIDIFEASKFATIYWLFIGFFIGRKYKYE